MLDLGQSLIIAKINSQPLWIQFSFSSFTPFFKGPDFTKHVSQKKMQLSGKISFCTPLIKDRSKDGF